jgi:hypothetical protein
MEYISPARMEEKVSRVGKTKRKKNRPIANVRGV